MIKKTMAIISILGWLIMAYAQTTVQGASLGNGLIITSEITVAAIFLWGVLAGIFYVIVGVIPQSICDRIEWRK